MALFLGLVSASTLGLHTSHMSPCKRNVDSCIISSYKQRGSAHQGAQQGLTCSVADSKHTLRFWKVSWLIRRTKESVAISL